METENTLLSCREAFHKWYAPTKSDKLALRRSDFNIDGYHLMQTQLSWTAWKAAWAAKVAVIKDGKYTFDGRTINTSFVHPPIPDRNMDWSATFDNYDHGEPIGNGATEVEAVIELIELVGMS